MGKALECMSHVPCAFILFFFLSSSPGWPAVGGAGMSLSYFFLLQAAGTISSYSKCREYMLFASRTSRSGADRV
jgi:hypothetical protein